MNRIDSILKDKNLKQETVADYAKISLESFTEWKNQKNVPTADIIFDIAHFLGVPVQYLITGESNHSRHSV